jgi:hypothetical protein
MPLSGPAGATSANTGESRDASNAATTSSNAADSQMDKGRVGKQKGFSRAAHSIMTMHMLRSTSQSIESVALLTRPTEKKDSWGSVMSSVVRKVFRQNGGLRISTVQPHAHCRGVLPPSTTAGRRALGVWFQTTKLNIPTDFERHQP